MKNSNYFIQKIIFILIAIGFAFNTASAQCDKKDNECWLEEGIYQIEEGDFEQAKKDLKKSYKGVFNKAPKNIRKEAKEVLNNKIPNFYEPINKYTTKGKQYQTDGFYVNAIEQFLAAEKLAKRNKRFATPHTKMLDQKMLQEIQELLPVLETERLAAVKTAITIGDEELANENYPRALSNFTIALREGSVAEQATNQIQQKADKCSFFVNLNKAKDLMASGSCETAYEYATKAVNYDSSPAARRLLGEATDCAHDNQIEEGNGQLETGDYESAISHFEKAKKYKNSSPEATSGITEAKNRAAQSYVEKAETHFLAENHAAAAEDFEKARSYNTNVVNAEGESISSLIEKHYDDLNGNGESFYSSEDFEGAAADFKAASYYKNKELMEKRVEYVQALDKAFQLEQSPHKLASISDLQKLKSYWAKAKKLKKGTNLSGGIDVSSKDDQLGKDISQATIVESLLPNFATATEQQKIAGRKDLNKIKIDCKYKRDALAKLGVPLSSITHTWPPVWRTVYDFNSKARNAKWKSTTHGSKSVNQLTFGVDSKRKGSARMIRKTLENGLTKKVLHTHPTWTSNGVIRGYFPKISKLPANSKLKGSCGFLKLPGSPKTDGAKFLIYIHYYVGQHKKSEQIFNSYKRYNKRTQSINIDLSRFAGKRAYFELRVDTGKTPIQDWAMWDGLVIRAKS